MADRGFDIRHLLLPQGVQLHIPAFSGGRAQFDRYEVVDARRLSSLRVHVERAIGRAKLHRLISNVMPLDAAPLAEEIVHVCFYLSNLHPPLVLNVSELQPRQGR